MVIPCGLINEVLIAVVAHWLFWQVWRGTVWTRVSEVQITSTPEATRDAHSPI